jgi:hypothetical protein
MSLLTELSSLRLARRIAASPDSSDDGIIHNVISANTAGDNTLIASPGSRLLILEIFLWNGLGAQTMLLKDGSILPLLQLTGLPVGGGLFLGFSGTGTPHFRVTAGNALLLYLSVGSQVDGFVKYRIAS